MKSAEQWRCLAIPATELCAKDKMKIPRSGDFSMLQTWPLRPAEAFQTESWRIYDLHFLYVAVLIARAAEIEGDLMKLSCDPCFLAGCTVVEMGAVIGSLETAFRICAVGDYLNLWKLKIPADYGARNLLGDSLASQFIRVFRSEK